jgi:hypothetical protein
MPVLWVLWSGVLLTALALGSHCPAHADEQSPPIRPVAALIGQRVEGQNTRRVNAPYDVPGEEAAILWFGRVTPTENSADARVLYQDSYLYVRVAMFDRRLWYDTSPTPGELTAWDAVSLYLDKDGNVGNVPDENAYRFDAQLVWWEPRDDYQVAFQGDGSGWVTATLPFTTTSGWRGTVPNNEEDDRGWALTFNIPYESLSLDGPPLQGEAWGMALVVHDRDDAAGTLIADQVWPETADPLQPATWGQLVFGLPIYDPLPAIPGETVTIRQGLDGATVVDADVGGSSVCGGSAAPDYFSTWGKLNYAGKTFANIQNLGDIGDWPCFSRYYVTFPLAAIPSHKVILSATLTLYQFGNAGEGEDPGPQPSLIQVLTVGEDWDESTITWNNAPLAQENTSAAWAYPLDPVPDWPGVPREWDVSVAVAQAYAAGVPARLALYEADWPYHSGKYFVTSDTDEWGQAARPTLRVAWGNAVGDLKKSVTPMSGSHGDPITYTVDFWAAGGTLRFTDTLPIGTSAPQTLQFEGTSIAPAYDRTQHRLTWTDAVPQGQKVTIRYGVTLTAEGSQLLVNMATLRDADGNTSTDSASVLVNPGRFFLPLIRKGE